MNEPENGFRAPSPEDLSPLFPNYKILSLIATGGMGAVYHAMQTSLEREVAIKILPVEFGDDQEFCKAFEAEAKAMAKLNHPNLIGVYDFGEVNEMLFIVMEYVPGQSVHEAANGSAVGPAEVIRLMTGICQGMAHAHQHGILHRDIKPANILLDSHLQPKIGDFGLARPLDSRVGEDEAIFGTPGYTAPEVLETPQTMDQRADIFSLGALLRELLTGLPPGSDTRLPSAISHCDPRFDAVVRKATHPDPLLRYQTAKELADALQKITSPAGPMAMRATPPAAAKRAAPQVHSKQPAGKGIGSRLLSLLPIAIIATLYIFKDELSHMVNPKPAPIIVRNPESVDPEPVNPGPVEPEPEPVKPEPVRPTPEPVKPEPDPVVSVPKPVTPEAEPVVSIPGTEPDNTKPDTGPQPKFDVAGFLARARSVMVTRCAPDIAKRDEALKRNVMAFRIQTKRLMGQNLDQKFHTAANSELDAYVELCKTNGNRMGEKLVPPLKFKPWIVALHEEHHAYEEKIDESLNSALTGHRNTYVQGLVLRVNSLLKDDPVAADLIKAELGKVNDSMDYFASLMTDATGKD